MIKMCMLLAVI